MALRLPLALCFVVSLSALVAPAAGQPAPNRAMVVPSTDASSVAEHVRQGDKARRAGRWAGAAEAYNLALAAAEQAGFPDPELAPILGELGVCETALSKYRDAAEHIHRSLSHDAVLTGDQRSRYRKAQATAESQVAKLLINVSPPGALVLIDETPIRERSKSHSVFIEPGKYTIRARLAGFHDEVITFGASAGSSSTLNLELKRRPSASTPIATGPRAPRALPPPEDPAAGLRTASFLVAGAGALVGSGLLIGSLVADNAMAERAAALRERAGISACAGSNYDAECDALHSSARARSGLAVVGWSVLGLSAGLAGVALTGFLWPTPEQSRASVQVSAIATGQQAGAVMTGAW